MNKKKTTSILQEINDFVPDRNREDIIESRASHAISQAMFIIDMINETYSEEEADVLVKRFVNSIRTGDPAKFSRSIKKIKESKK